MAAPQLRRLVAGFPPWRPGFEHGYGHVGFVVDKVAMAQVFSVYFGFPCQSSFNQLFHNHHQHLGLVQYASSTAAPLTSAPDEGEWSASRLCSLTPEVTAPELGGLQTRTGRYGEVKKNFFPCQKSNPDSSDIRHMA
jgi:hypothetical protein